MSQAPGKGRSRTGRVGRRASAGAPVDDGGNRLFPSGSQVQVVHAKPWKKTVTMTGIVRAFEDGLLTLERTFSAGGRYDSLGAPKLTGDWGTVEIPEGGWTLRRAYYRVDGTLVGELYNVQTPARFRPGLVRYVDLEVDVVRHPDGRVQVVDEADLDAAVRVRGITPRDAEVARAIAYRLADLLRFGGDWREADADYRRAGPSRTAGG